MAVMALAVNIQLRNNIGDALGGAHCLFGSFFRDLFASLDFLRIWAMMSGMFFFLCFASTADFG